MNKFNTVAGVVILEPVGHGRWTVLTTRGKRVLGTVELENEDGQYAAVTSTRRQVCANLVAAVQVVASAR